ncbi:MAG TPA: hypothetical protein VH638_05820 [Gemmatimonadaceae bacterium]|jgi:hypothetical protein
MRKLGCVVVIFLAGMAVAIWMYLERPRREAEMAAAPVWEALTPEGAARARASVQVLSRSTGPVFTNIGGADLASYIFDELSKQLPPSSQNLEAAVIDDRLHVRALVKLTDFGGSGALGPLASMLGDREPVEFGGTLDLVRPGLAQYRVKVLRLRELSVPSRMIPRLLQRVARGSRPPGLADDGLPLEVPAFVADVRIGDGRVTLYKSTAR